MTVWRNRHQLAVRVLNHLRKLEVDYTTGIKLDGKELRAHNKEYLFAVFREGGFRFAALVSENGRRSVALASAEKKTAKAARTQRKFATKARTSFFILENQASNSDQRRSSISSSRRVTALIGECAPVLHSVGFPIGLGPLQ